MTSGEHAALPPPSGQPLDAGLAPPVPVPELVHGADEPGAATASDGLLSPARATAPPPRRLRVPRWAKLGAAAAVAFGGAAWVTAAQREDEPTASRSTVTSIASPTIAASTSPSTIAPATTVAAATTATVTTTAASTTTQLPPPTTAAVTNPPPTTPPPPTIVLVKAPDVLSGLDIGAERAAGFSASAFSTAGAVDADGCDLRARLLRRESRVPAEVGNDCTVTAGEWASFFGDAVVEDPGALVAAPTVSPREAWRSGAWAWGPAKRAAFVADVTDARTVHVVTAASVRARAERDPTGWLPETPYWRCAYVADWLAVKARWGLTVDQNEATLLGDVLRTTCPELVVPQWAPAPAPAEPETPAPPTTEPYYLDCADAERRGVTSIPRGAPGYRPPLDGNGNGIACE